MKILHIINSLNKGGAEGNLYRLCEYHKKKYKKKIKITIITLINNGYYEKKLKKLGVKIIPLNFSIKKKIYEFIKKIITFRYFVERENPDIIQSWMYHSNFFTLFISKKFYNKLFWNIRHSELNTKISKKTTIIISLICGIFSKFFPKKIIYCSPRSIKFHEKHHLYSKNKSTLVYNGYSDKSFYSKKNLRFKFRKYNNIKKNDLIIGYAGRFARQKNIFSILKAFSKITKKYENAYLCMVGRDINNKNIELFNCIKSLKIIDRVIFIPEQKNLLDFYNGIDFLLLASHSESFPNVIAESMLCETPVISSDAGCARTIINGNGFIMKKNDYKTISRFLNRTIKLFKYKKKKWNFLKVKARKQIKNNFHLYKSYYI